jgi:hypothetical protein
MVRQPLDLDQATLIASLSCSRHCTCRRERRKSWSTLHRLVGIPFPAVAEKPFVRQRVCTESVYRDQTSSLPHGGRLPAIDKMHVHPCRNPYDRYLISLPNKSVVFVSVWGQWVPEAVVPTPFPSGVMGDPLRSQLMVRHERGSRRGSRGIGEGMD